MSVSGPQVAEELGIPIRCDSTGTFSAEMNGETFFEKSIAKVRKWIKASARTVKVLIHKKDSTYSPCEVIQIAVVEPYGDGYRARKVHNDRYSGVYNDQREPLFIYDETVAQCILDIWNDAARQKEEINQRRNEDIAEQFALLTPLTTESFAAALAEADNDKA